MVVPQNSINFSTLLLTIIVGLVISKSEAANTDHTIQNPGLSHYQKQLQLLKLFNNFRCWKDWDLQDVSYRFNPLNNLELYKDPQLVRNYFEGLERGQGLRRDEPFANNYLTLAELEQIFTILYDIDDWNLFYKTSAYALGRVNVGLFYWALNTVVSNKYAYEHLRTPPPYEVFPQFFAPKSVIYKLNGRCKPKAKLSNGAEAKLSYYQDDPSLSAFHLAWHFVFPFWWKSDAYKVLKDRKGELFLYMHRQMLNRHRAERLSVGGLDDISSVNLNEAFQVGYVPTVLYINFNEITPRLNNSWIKDTPTMSVKVLQKEERDLHEAIFRGYFINDNGTHVSLRSDAGFDIIGSTVEASEQTISEKKYGLFHNSLHGIISKIADPDGSLKLAPGILAHPEASVRDPAFYRIHTTVDNFYRQQSKNLKAYSKSDLSLYEVQLKSVRIQSDSANEQQQTYSNELPQPSSLETFLEDFSFEVSNGIKTCDEIPSNKLPTTIRRLNHRPFKHFLKIYSNLTSSTKTTVRIYLSPTNGFDGKPCTEDKLYANMIELDRFTAALSPGENLIVRSSTESAVTVPDATTTEELVRRTEEAIATGMDNSENWKGNKPIRHCGYPHNLLLPRGTPEGMEFKLFAILTEEEEGLDYPGLPLCGVGNGMFPDKKPMGFPFEREIKIGQPLPSDNYKFIDVVIKHAG